MEQGQHWQVLVKLKLKAKRFKRAPSRSRHILFTKSIKPNKIREVHPHTPPLSSTSPSPSSISKSPATGRQTEVRNFRTDSRSQRESSSSSTADHKATSTGGQLPISSNSRRSRRRGNSSRRSVPRRTAFGSGLSGDILWLSVRSRDLLRQPTKRQIERGLATFT